MRFIPLSCLLLLLFTRCSKNPDTLFVLKNSEESGVTFVNHLQETDSFNILTYEYIYNGGGVGIADFNNDGLTDIFFTGNQVPNALYLNKGDFHFKDISAKANVNVKGRWNSGVTIVDINNDGWMDVYVCATAHPLEGQRKNMMFVNQGLDAGGEPVFKEMAADYNIDSDTHSVMAAFLDYDLDGDLDLYILVNQKLGSNVPTNYRPKITDGTAANNDRLMRNDGNGKFTDVSSDAGIVYEGFGLGLSISDVNMDGWPDIYVSNDYLSNDILYINQQNGTFKNATKDWIGHQSQFSMGNDAADINNDGLPDIMTLDMLPEINARKKTTIGNKSYQTYINNEEFGYEYQYVRNMVHLNNGLGEGIKFSEVGQLTGIYQTEWSWSTLFADFDNDGNKDVLITNGFPKDITDKDFGNFRAEVSNIASNRYMIDSIPIVKIPNYAYKNNGDLTFTDVTKSWGMTTPSFSNGAAFADFDNDGDLDYVVNNIDDKAFVYENTLYSAAQKKGNSQNYLRIKLEGPKDNVTGLGSKISIYYDSGKMQFEERAIYRGFLSSVEAINHFGLGSTSTVDSLIVQWPDGSIKRLTSVPTNQVLAIKYDNTGVRASSSSPRLESDFTLVNKKYSIQFVHSEDDKVDYNWQRTLPHKFSQAGPGISVGDINGDHYDDFIIGGSANYSATIFVQKVDGTFNRIPNLESKKVKLTEDEGLLLFDADNDGDLDLYVVSGSIESQDEKEYQDQFYINDGSGNFSLAENSLPNITASGSCVRAADYDADGDLDLFVGGRVVPGAYPLPAQSYILRNDNGKFTDVTQVLSSTLSSIGLVTDALWTDFNNDNKIDLVVVGEFMAVTFFVNENNQLKPFDAGIGNYTGWWNSISAGDFDNDGDTDYVVGNLGLNNGYQVTQEYPLKIIANDFDNNGSIDPVLACYMRESMESDKKKLYPVHFWDELNSQSPKFRKKFGKYKQYSKVEIDQLFTPDELEGALTLEANHMASSYIENLGNGKFNLKALPTVAQVAPVNGIVTDDVNDDGNLDILLVGNDYGNEVFAGRYDAFTGLTLLGDGKGSFTTLSSAQSGLYVKGDAKALVKLWAGGNELILASQNRDSLLVFEKRNHPATRLNVQPMDSWASLRFENGKTQRIEFYYGSGYLSQSSREISIPSHVREIIIHTYAGKSRKIMANDLASHKK